ncbi:MAG: dUTP diphosphatase [Clostridia bacterium]|nr:dUTP diphosphatase [Clostridia bacterium]
MRKFEVVKDEFIKYGVKKEDLKKPYRATRHAVCYDCFSPIDIVIPAESTELVFINYKAYCNTDEGYILASTSSLGKKGIILANGIGIIESDYADNVTNDGNIGFLLHNLNKIPYQVKAGDKIGQIFFFKFLTVDDDVPADVQRTGGFGSTNRN